MKEKRTPTNALATLSRAGGVDYAIPVGYKFLKSIRFISIERGFRITLTQYEVNALRGTKETMRAILIMLVRNGVLTWDRQAKTWGRIYK